MEKCVWRESDGYWNTICGCAFDIFCGTPTENEMKYCCYCGKEIEEIIEEWKIC